MHTMILWRVNRIVRLFQDYKKTGIYHREEISQLEHEIFILERTFGSHV